MEHKENKTIRFGTGGIRAPMGDDADQINTLTIRKAAAALAMTLAKDDPQKKVYIGFDTRKNAAAFAKETALTLNAFGFGTVLFKEPVPVPLLSFVLKRGNCLGGVMITASHNPKEYNGFKVYNRHGGQITPAEASEIEKYLPAADPSRIPPLTEAEAVAKGLFFYGGKAEEAAYLSRISKTRDTRSDLTVVATPLHGAAWKLLPAALKRCGHNVVVPPSQATPNGDFPTVAAPNPEDPAVFREAEILGKSVNADLLLATDGDGDRCSCCVKHNGTYHYLCGNDIAAILLYYLTQKYPCPAKGYVVKTDVSGELGAAIAKAAGMEIRTVPTGFKHIGAMITQGKGTFFAGYEESGGFLFGDHTADKDGIQTATLLAEAAAFYKQKGKTLFDVREEIFCRFGREYTATRKFPFPKGNETSKTACLEYFKATSFHGFEKEVRGNTIFFTKENRIKIALRPSGTEPDLKLYILISFKKEGEATSILRQVEKTFCSAVKDFIPQREEY